MFTGDTASLRTFLNDLNKFDLPIVVRSIEVDHPSGAETTVAPKESNELDAIFSIFGDSSASVQDKQAAADQLAKPVILGNTSRFTVVLEYFEIILPVSDSTDEAEVQSDSGMKQVYDKLLLLLAVLALAEGCAFYFTASKSVHPRTGSLGTNQYVPIEANNADVVTVEWGEPEPQPSGFIYDVFTPYEIYLDENGNFTQEGPNIKVAGQALEIPI